MNRRHVTWDELSPTAKGAAVAVASVQLALFGYALRDVLRRPAAELSAPRPVWVAACFVNLVGPLAYLRFGRRRPA